MRKIPCVVTGSLAATLLVGWGNGVHRRSDSAAAPLIRVAVATSPMLTPETAPSDGGLFAPSISAPLAPPAPAGAAPRPTILVPVPPLPGDLEPIRPPTTPPPLVDVDHDHRHVDNTEAADIAAAWVAALYTARFDDPVGLSTAELAALAARPAVAEAAAAALPAPSVADGEARWPYIVALHDDDAGWWNAEILLKTTRRGQVGPSSTPLTVRVHVTEDLHVDEWATLP